MILGELLKNNRIKQGFSFQEVADKTGYNLNSLKKYERAGDKNGVFPPMDKLARLAVLYQIDPREIFAVCADKDIDTRTFYELDGRASSAEEISDALEETNEILRKYGFGELEQDELDDEYDGELDIKGVAIHEAIRSVVTTTGIETRCLPALITEARKNYELLELDDMLELAESYCLLPEKYKEGIVDVDKLLLRSLKERDKWCVQCAEVLIANAIYGAFFWFLDEVSIYKLYEHFGLAAPTDFTGESALYAITRALNDAIISREPVMLHDEDQFSWLVELHHLPVHDSEWANFFKLNAGIDKHRDSIRLYDKYGMWFDHEKPEEASLATGSSGSNPINSTENRKDDG